MNDAQLEILFQEYGYLVQRRCQALLAAKADAEDALQDVFLRAARYGDSQTGASKLAWLYAIAFNVCCDHLKRRRREQPEAPEVIARRQEEVAGTLEEADRRAVVSVALRQSGRRTREMAVLHYVAGYTQEEVAERSGYSRKTVGKKLRAFADRLRSRWEGREDGHE